MAALEGVLVSDLMKMSVDELRERGVIKLKDPENMTAELTEKLRLLINGLDQSRGLDLGLLDSKLSHLAEAAPTSPTARSSLGSRTDSFSSEKLEDLRQEFIRGELDAYHDLIEDGGRPTHRPNETGHEYLNEPQNCTDIISYWMKMCHNVNTILQQQRFYWNKFREYQDWRRGRYWKPEWFEQFVQYFKTYRREKNLEGDIYLLQDRKEQSKLQDWAEFQYWEYKKADNSVRARERYTEEVKEQEARLQRAIDAGEPAEKIETIDYYGLRAVKGRRGGAELDLEIQSALLKWIDEQLPIIASECQQSALSTQVPNERQLPSESTSLGKRKRSTDETDHVEDSRRRVRFADSCGEESSARNAVDRCSSLVGSKSQTSRTQNTSNVDRGHKSTMACAEADKIDSLNHPAPVHHESRTESTNSPRRSGRRAISLQMQHESRPVRASPETSEMRQQSAATLAEEEITSQKSIGTRQSKEVRRTSVTPSKRSNSTLSGRQGRAPRGVHSSRYPDTRGQTYARAPAGAAYSGDARRPSRKAKQKDKFARARGGNDVVKNHKQKRLTTDATVRRSPRLERKPAVRYWEVKIIQ